jgi:hypothetical protein
VERRSQGRPTIFDTPLTRTIKVRVTEAQFDDLKTIAAAEDKDESTLIRDAVDSYVGDFRERRLFFLSKKQYQPE